MVTEKEIWQHLDDVFDPEIPVLTVADLGIVRKVEVSPKEITITITPTYSGCPAMQRIESDIREKISEVVDIPVRVTLVLAPAWTTDWITETGKKKLEEYGIAPPVDEPDKSVLFAEPIVVPCPKCTSKNTRMISQFGSTACKAHYQCNDCQEPFDYFKCLR